MGCSACGDKPKKDNSFTKAVVEIDNPENITLIRKVVVPASMGDDTTVPPVVGKYKNVLLYYEANSKVYLYSSDGIPTQLVNGVTDYEAAVNLPQINGVTLLGDKSAADLELADAPMVITVADGNTGWSGADTAEDVYDFFLNKGKVNIVFNGGGNYAYEIASAAYIPEEEKMMCTLAVATIAAGEPTEFEGNALFGTMTLYTADKAIDVSQIELQPKLYVPDFTGLDLNYNELSGVPATNASIGMVKPGDGLEVASDGALSISEIEQYAHFFDTVADMKAATNLVNGSYAHTSGYYDINDGGESLYLILDNEPTSGNTVKYETLDSGLYALLIPDGKINVKQFGAIGDGASDDTVILNNAFNYGVSRNIPIELVGGETYLITDSIIANLPNNALVVNGNGANIKMNGNKKYNGIEAVCKEIDISNLKFNGDGSNQDQFDQTNYSDLIIFNGLSLSSDNIYLKNIEMRDWYGGGMRFYNYHNINIDNVIINNVGGHWYQNNNYDAFGDAISFAGHSGDANINISNVDATGKYKGTTLSRIGMTFSFPSNKTDILTNVNVSNSNFVNYDRGIHVEDINGNVHINYNNGKIHSNVALFNYGNTNDQVKFSGDNLVLDYHTENFSGSNGIYNSCFDIKNSTINCNCRLSLGMFGANGTYYNCVFNNVTRVLFTTPNGANEIKIKDSTINIGALTTYLNYNYDIEWENCVFNSDTVQTEIPDAKSMGYSSCVLNNFLPNYKPLDLNNQVRIQDSSFTDNQMNTYRSAYLYEDNSLIASPNLSKTFPVNDINIYNYFGSRTIPSGSTITLVPTFDGSYLRPNSKYLLITIGFDSWSAIRDGRGFNNYYYNIITTDNSGTPTIGETNTVGDPTSGGYGLTLDTSGNTIARGGSYGNVANQWLLPYHYKDYLKNFA